MFQGIDSVFNLMINVQRLTLNLVFFIYYPLFTPNVKNEQIFWDIRWGKGT